MPSCQATRFAHQYAEEQKRALILQAAGKVQQTDMTQSAALMLLRPQTVLASYAVGGLTNCTEA